MSRVAIFAAWSFAALAPVGAGCSERSPTGEEPGLTIRVAPIEYPEIEDVAYEIGVYTRVDGDYQLVWSEDEVTSQQYGNGQGAITYVGPCDAQGQADGWTPDCEDDPEDEDCGCADPDDCDAASEKPAWVVISVASITADGDEVEDDAWVNPCREFDFDDDADPTGADCVREVMCEENADTRVAFDLTILRDAGQGFFDFVVEFEDIFCSAKFDTCYDDTPSTEANEAGWIKLLMKDTDDDGVPDTRWNTGVLAFACTGGPGADTHLYLDDIVIDCEGAGPIRIDPSQAEAGNADAPDGQDVVFAVSTYFGDEDLTCGGGGGGGTPALQLSVCGDVTCPLGQVCDISGQACTQCTPDDPDACDDGFTCTGSPADFLCVGEADDEPPVSCSKKYWSVAIGFDVDVDAEIDDTCTLYTSATASDGELEDAWATRAGSRYPVIRFVIPLTQGDELACDNWGLDETEGEGVFTSYTSMACGVDEAQDLATGDEGDCDFCHAYGDGDAPGQSDRPECDGVAPPQALYTASCVCDFLGGGTDNVERGCFTSATCEEDECEAICQSVDATWAPGGRNSCTPGCQDG